MIITSILDDDLYKFTQQQAVWKLYPNAQASYKFINRRPTDTFDENFLDKLREEIKALGSLSLTGDEWAYLRSLGLFDEQYLDFLSSYRYYYPEVFPKIVDGQLQINIFGPWCRTILWEVKLMALISELYFADRHVDYSEYAKSSRQKARELIKSRCKFSDFGTRRRYSYTAQDVVNETMATTKTDGFFLGTSNPHLAMKYNIPCKGTIAHEFIMGMSALQGIRHANRYAMEEWAKVYHGKLGVALTDTFGTDVFLDDFDSYFARLWDGVRQDSGDPLLYAAKMVHHYNKLGIDPQSKFIVFSNSLDVNAAIYINQNCKMPCQFGIGTHLTNDFPNVKALNMVIKLDAMNGIPVVKLSDDKEKACGDKDAVRVARWVCYGKKLDD